jgi:hypothetical protein
MSEGLLTSASWPGQLQCPLASMVLSSWYEGCSEPHQGFPRWRWRWRKRSCGRDLAPLRAVGSTKI